MIEFNLLPDIKVEYLKTEHTKRRVFAISVIVAGIATAIILIMFAALELQSHQISSNKKQIAQLSGTLTNTTDINKILTIQNQLKTVVGLYNKAPQSTRLYDYLTQVVPKDATISHLILDFSTDTLRISGDAPNLETINTFADTLKFAEYSVDGASQTQKAFPAVVLQSFARGASSASYSFSITFDPLLFDRSHNVKMVVPQDYVSTRSFTELPSNNLFNGPANQGGGQ